jgi:ubiquitin-protein ligase
MHISAGLVDPEDIFLTEWNASMMGTPGTAFEDHFYELRVFCSPDYPIEPPAVRFISRINMGCVNQVCVILFHFFSQTFFFSHMVSKPQFNLI